MVLFRSVIISAALFGLASARPTRPDEIPVSAPDGTPKSDVPTSTADSNNNYGGQYGGQYGGYGMATTTADSTSSTMMSESSSMMTESTTMMEDKSSSTMTMESTSTVMSYMSQPTYGSGKTNWGSGYDDCVQKCVASYGAPPGTYQATATGTSEGSKGTGSTVTVIVAPTQGVFRYVPVAVNASVGTTIEFRWGAGPHTVTKSSALLPCNKSADANTFTSGQQQKDFVFTQVVNDTNPTYYYCGVPSHCQKGMFGMINPPSAFGAATSVGGMMQSMMANNSDFQAYAAYTANNTAGKPGSNWGQNINLKDMPEWAQGPIAENVMFTRNLLAMNPEILKDDGSIDLSSVDKVPLKIPQDIGAQINAAGAGAAGNDAAVNASGSPSGTSSGAQPTNTSSGSNGSNGASSLASPRALVALMAIVATFFAL